jgi:hypothetical protein
MKYVPAFNINAPGVHESIRLGQMRVQPGQWVWTDDKHEGTPSRFVDAGRGYLNVVHATGPFAQGPFDHTAFTRRIAALKRTR